MSLLCLCSVVVGAVCGAPNVVFLSVDTLRADYLGCYGCAHDASPNLDAFAGEALVFEDCVCEVPLTNPSFASMLSSLYPRMTGTTRNGLRIQDSAPLVAEAFRKAGYETLCVQSNWTLKSHLSGLDRGFDVYEEDFHTKRWGVIKPERYAADVTDTALKILKRRNVGKPFFLWIHYSDPHAPYNYHKKHNPVGMRPGRLARTERVRLKYASEVAYADHHIGRFLDALPSGGTAVLFVSDHGESLYEHNYLGHGRRIYHDNLHIPLMIRAKGVEAGRTRMPARGIDIAPTLLALAGLDAMPGMLGKDLLSAEIPMTRIRVVETYGGAVPKLPGAKALMKSASPQRQGVVAAGWKLIIKGRGPELFNLREDPKELNNLASDMPGRVAELRESIKAWDVQYARGKSTAAALSDDDLEALKGLGYLE